MLQHQNQHLLDQGGYERKKYTGNKHECLDSRFLYFLGLQYDATNKIDVFRMISILILILTIFRDHVTDQLPGLISCSVKPSITIAVASLFLSSFSLYTFEESLLSLLLLLYTL
jgi:hypothetical protein